MSIRIGEDGSIISSEGEIQQGQNPLIGEDGSIRLNDQPTPGRRASYGGARRPPSSPLMNSTNSQRAGSSSEASENASLADHAASRGSSRPMSTIEYELQVKKAELGRCIRPAPIVVCVIFILLSILMSSFVPAIVSACAAVFIVMDFVRRSQVAEEVQRLEGELEKAQSGGVQ